MRELQRKLDHDAKLQQFLGVKGQHRVNTELEARENNKRRQQQEELEAQMEEYSAIIEKIKVRLTAHFLFCERKKYCFLGDWERFYSFLQNFSTEEDVEKLASQFKKQEEENFALFNYVNELSHEVETL